MKRPIRLLALFLGLLTVLSLLAACGGDNGKTTTKGGTVTTAGGNVTTAGGVTTQGSGTTAAVTTGNGGGDYRYDEDGFVLDNIPDNVDLEERTVKALYWMNTTGEKWIFPSEESENDVIQSEVFQRNLGLEARLNCHFAPTGADGGWTDRTDFISKASKSNEEHNDIIISHALIPAALAQKDILYNLTPYDFPQVEMPWWPSSISEWTQYGTLFFVSDTSSPKNIWAKEVTFVDLQQIMEAGLDDPLQLVIDKKWTLDAMYEYVSAFADRAVAAKTSGTTFYSVAVDDVSRMDAFYYGAGGCATRNNAKGIATLGYSSSSDVAKATSIIDKTIKIMETAGAYISTTGANKTPMINREAAFYVATLGYILETNDDFPYAPMPMPMYDEAQGGYKTVNNDNHDCMCVPIGAADPEASALILEAIASADYREIAPVFYEDKLKSRYSRSELGNQIYDIILSSMFVDFGSVAALDFSIPDAGIRACFTAKEGAEPKCNNTFATWVQSKNANRAVEIKLTELLTVYKKHRSENQ